MIKINKINKSYSLGKKNFRVLKDLSLNIKIGEMVALTGQSGSGKSTLLNIIGMLDDYDDGEYFLNDILIKKQSQDKMSEYRNQYIGFIFQHFHLISFKSALENVALPLYYRNVSQAERNDKAMDILEKLGLKDKANNKTKELSGGQQQRVSIARALVTDAPLILADEPTGALDSKTTDEVLEILFDINKDGKTIIIVTHEPEVAKICKRHIKMVDGQIAKASVSK